MLTNPDNFLVIHVLGLARTITFPRYRGETDWLLVSSVLLFALLEDEGNIYFPPVFGHFSQSP